MTITPNAQLNIAQAKIVGNPELRAFGNNGDKLFRARLMVPGIGKGGGNGFLDVAVFDDAEAIAAQVGTGSIVTFRGQLRFREWQDSATGAKRSALSATGTLAPLEQPEAAPKAKPARATRGAAK